MRKTSESSDTRSKNVTPNDSLRTFRLIGAVAALLAVLGIAGLLIWFVMCFPRF